MTLPALCLPRFRPQLMIKASPQALHLALVALALGISVTALGCTDTGSAGADDQAPSGTGGAGTG